MKLQRLTHIALLAAGYCALTLVISPLSFGPVQFRLAEALMVLALNGKDDIWGLSLGCFLANLIGIVTSLDAVGPLDAVFGTLATLLAGILMYRLRYITVKGWPLAAVSMPVICNGLIVGAELAITVGGQASFIWAWLIYGLQVAAGEAVVMAVLGLPLYRYLVKRKPA